MSQKLPITVIFLTHNEEKNIRLALESVRDWAQEIFIVDSGSTDKTLEIAKESSCQIYHHPFETFSRQWQWAITEVPIANEWVLGIDADQRIPRELAHEFREVFSKDLRDVEGFYIKRRQYFLGKWIKHGTYYPRYLLKLFRRSKVMLDDNELMDHHFYVAGRTAKLKHDFIEDNKKECLDFWIEKHNHYASMQAREEVLGICRPMLPVSLFRGQDRRRLWLKQIWSRLPLFVRPFLYFIYRYILRLGFLDGKEGLIFHFLHAFWYRFLVDAKIYEVNHLAHKGRGL